MSRRRKQPPPQQVAGKGNLPLMTNIAAWCEGSITSILKMCDWHVQRESDGGVLGFRAAPGGGAKVLAVAHLDYLGTGKVHEVDAHHIVSSALDDRLGACLAYNMQVWTGIPLDVVFCDKEERGESTLPTLGTAMLDKYNWIVEMDRRGEGAVCYEYTVMEPYIKKHFELHQGSFSDICTICHVSPVGAFNMAVGYDLEHTERCNATTVRVVNQLRRFRAFYNEFQDVRIEHKPPTNTMWQYRKNRSWRGGSWSNDDWDNWGNHGTVESRQGKAKHDRNWTTDKHGVIQLGTADVLLRWHKATLAEIQWLRTLGWIHNWNICGHGAFIKDDDITKPLTVKQFNEMLDDAAADKKMAQELKEMTDTGEMTDQDIVDYEQLGWHYSKRTGLWYKGEVPASGAN